MMEGTYRKQKEKIYFPFRISPSFITKGYLKIIKVKRSIECVKRLNIIFGFHPNANRGHRIRNN